MYICVTGMQNNILWLGNSVKWATTSAVGLSCLPRLATVVMIPPPVVSSPSVGANIPRGATRVLATNLCFMCFML